VTVRPFNENDFSEIKPAVEEKLDHISIPYESFRITTALPNKEIKRVPLELTEKLFTEKGKKIMDTNLKKLELFSKYLAKFELLEMLAIYYAQEVSRFKALTLKELAKEIYSLDSERVIKCLLGVNKLLNQKLSKFLFYQHYIRHQGNNCSIIKAERAYPLFVKRTIYQTFDQRVQFFVHKYNKYKFLTTLEHKLLLYYTNSIKELRY